jgi:hypothetical protein
MVNGKTKKAMRELKGLRYRAHPQLYDKKTVERKKRLRDRIRHLRTESSKGAP